MLYWKKREEDTCGLVMDVLEMELEEGIIDRTFLG